MQLRAHLTIEIDAEDFVSAAEHQRQLEAILDEVQRHYAEARLEIRERRTPAARAETPPGTVRRRRTGALNSYESDLLGQAS